MGSYGHINFDLYNLQSKYFPVGRQGRAMPTRFSESEEAKALWDDLRGVRNIHIYCDHNHTIRSYHIVVACVVTILLYHLVTMIHRYHHHHRCLR